MSKYKISQRAGRDIVGIAKYIAKDSKRQAYIWLDNIYKTIEMLASHPALGHDRTDITPSPVKFWPQGSYFVIYQQTMPIEIVRVVSRYQDILHLFK